MGDVSDIQKLMDRMVYASDIHILMDIMGDASDINQNIAGYYGRCE